MVKQSTDLRSPYSVRRELPAAPSFTDSCELTTDNDSSGFTLLELMIVLAIIAILATLAVPAYTANVRRAKEAVLRTDLDTMRKSIDSYTYDKQKAPQTLDDLVQAGYLKAIPQDPFTHRTDTWMTGACDNYTSIDETQSGGICDVHSGAQEVSSETNSYATW
jgi:general secretion pathway protein G